MTLEINANNSFEVEKKFNALKELEKGLSGQELERLASLSRSDKGKSYLNSKWFMLKSFLGIK